MNIINACFLITALSFGVSSVAMDQQANQRKDSLRQQILLNRAQQRARRKQERKHLYPYDLNRNFEVKCPAKRCSPDS